MNYIKRDMEEVFIRASDSFKIVLVTGPRQVGKTTMLEKLMEGTNRKYVSLDDIAIRNLAKNDPKAFTDTYTPPVFIDEVQYAPELFSYIKMRVDKHQENGAYWLSGSQVYKLMRGVGESLAGRVCLLDLYPLSQNELYNHKKCSPLELEHNHLTERTRDIPDAAPADIYSRIYNGGMPELHTGDISKQNYKETYYESYIRTYIERDVRDLSGNINALKFYRFIVAVAARTAQLVNYKSIADDAEIDQVTAKNWLNILETLGIIYYLHPYSNNLLKRTIKSPKLYFYDTGLATHLTRWNSIEALMNGAVAGAMLENYTISELIKGYYNSGKRHNLYYFRDKDNKEIDVLWEQNGTLYPMEIKKSSSPDIRLTKVFNLLEKSGKSVGNGAVACLYDSYLPLDNTNYIVPVKCI